MSSASLSIALEHLRAGRYAEVSSLCRDVVASAPDVAAGWQLLGIAKLHLGAVDEAIELLRRSTQLAPHDPIGHYNLGLAYHRRGALGDAGNSYLQAILRDPNHADAYQNLGRLMCELEKFPEAVGCYERLLTLRPNDFHAFFGLGNARRELGDLNTAESFLRRALEFKPLDADTINNLGAVMELQGRLDAAETCFLEVLRINPEYHQTRWNLAILQLLRGDFEQGWRGVASLRIFESPEKGTRRFSQPIWDGSSRTGQTILLHEAQGLGDVIHLVRYAEQVKRRVGRVVLECDPPLVSLLGRAPGVDLAVARGGPLPPFDVQSMMLELPGLFGTRLESIPARIPYLSADPTLVRSWRDSLTADRSFRVGIHWHGNPKNRSNRRRSLPLACFEPLARVPGVRLYGLQKGPGWEQLAELNGRFEVVDMSEKLTDFDQTAALMANLDLIVTCESAPAHLAGALGVPVWVAIPFAPSWQWLLDRPDSVWYPGMQLFRQKDRTAWSEVMQQMAANLERLVTTRRRSPATG